MLSANAITNELACRFCWMCRHLCPIGLVTGRESNTPRAKGLLLDMVERGEPYSASMAAEMYECCLCGACAASCETGFDPRVFIREARTQAVVDGLTPPAVKKLLDSIESFDTIYGVKAGKNPAAKYASDKAGILLYAGPTAVLKTPNMVDAVARLMKKADVPFIAWEEEPACGAELYDLIGPVDETLAAVKPLAEKIRASGVDKVVVIDPYQAKFLRQDCPALGCDLGVRIETATEFFAGLVKEGKLKPKKMDIRGATYHDTSRLARDLDETEPARELLAAMGIEIKEMFLNRQNTRCCGDEILAGHSPHIAALTAKARWEDVERCGASGVIVPCPTSFDMLDSQKPDGKTVQSLFCLLAEACGA